MPGGPTGQRVSETTFRIAGGDYEKAGWASRNLKDQLKQIGAAPEQIRRVMIAAYEAEMNVVIHAQDGTMKVALDRGRLDVEVADRGPGIADIPLAMTEGYSTAPAKARELGFGAGMGLPNIRRSSDRFTIESTAGVGTRICFTVFLRPQEATAAAPNSLRISPDRCTACLRCLHACPTRAMRLRPNGPMVLDHLCIDCTSCMQACPAGTLAPDGATDEIHAAGDTVLVVPPAFVAQFASSCTPARVLDALRDLGFGQVLLTESAEQALQAAAIAHAVGQSDEQTPTISPVCPAVLNLIATKFPSLLESVAPFLSPAEATREGLIGRRVVFLTLCPAQVTAIRSGSGPAKVDIILPATLSAAIHSKLASSQRGTSAESVGDTYPTPPLPRPIDTQSSVASPRAQVLRVAGMRHVLNVLEMIENGLIREAGILELYACDEGCFGSPLLAEDACLSRRRWQQAAVGQTVSPEKAMPRKAPLPARPGLRLDKDMTSAIRKLAEIDRIRQSLPGRDCGLCGCPTCAAMAEDVVLGRISAGACKVDGRK